MTDVNVNLFLDVHPSKAKLTLFLDGNCFLIASTVSVYSLRQILLRVLADGNTKSLRNALYTRHSSRFDIAFDGIWAETKPNMRWWFQLSSWNSAVWKSFDASFERFVFQFNEYFKSKFWIWISFVNLQSVYLYYLYSWVWPKRFHRPSNRSVRLLLTLFNSLTLQCALLSASVCPFSWSHVLTDGEELDDKRYLYCQDSRSPQFRSVNRIPTKAHV
jgi:hypothetical protein